ncbi:MAG: DUF1566 domain-containing protein [Thermodesulfobacteriota bacterium]|jgi:hypothetical protein
MKKLLVLLCVTLFFFGITGMANATLYDRGGSLIYDSDQDITWLQDANYAQTSGHDSDGLMTWDNAMVWADQLVYGGFDDWRLPTTEDGPYVFGYNGTTTAGYNITTSEMGYMYYVNLGNPWYSGILNNTGPFINLQPDLYWSGSEFTSWSGHAWTFYFYNGVQDDYSRGGPLLLCLGCA